MTRGKIFLEVLGGFSMQSEEEDVASCLPHQSFLEGCEVIANSRH